jgi:chromosome segregation ATPase
MSEVTVGLHAVGVHLVGSYAGLDSELRESREEAARLKERIEEIPSEQAKIRDALETVLGSRAAANKALMDYQGAYGPFNGDPRDESSLPDIVHHRSGEDRRSSVRVEDTGHEQA